VRIAHFQVDDDLLGELRRYDTELSLQDPAAILWLVPKLWSLRELATRTSKTKTLDRAR